MSKPTPKPSLSELLFSNEKFFRREALAKCSLCNDALPQEACTQECSKYYHTFKQGERMLLNKYNKCVSKCKDDKCKKDCEEIASKDLQSLINLIKKDEKEATELGPIDKKI